MGSKKLFFYELEGRGYIFQNKKWDETKHGFEDDMLNMAWEMWSSAKHGAKAQAVPNLRDLQERIGGHQYYHDEHGHMIVDMDDVVKEISGFDGWKAQAVPEGFGLFDGDTLTYSNGYSINCSFDDEFDCHIFDVYQNEDCVKDGMTQLEQAHCLVLSMIKLDAKDSMIEAQEQSHD